MDTRKFAMNYGAVLGSFLVLISLLFWALSIKQNTSAFILNSLIIIVFLIYAIIQFRDNINQGCISYSLSLKLGTSISFFSSIIMAFYTLVYITYLDSEYIAEILNMTEQSILQQSPEISDENLDGIMGMYGKLMQPHWLMIMGVLEGTFLGFFFSLILSSFLKKTDAK